MENNRIISSLCYFSIFFAGFILPLIVLLVIKEQDVKKHAKHALISHLLLYLPVLIGFIIFFFFSLSSPSTSDNAMAFYGIGTIILFILFALFTLAIIIWNIYRGIKVLNTNSEEAA